jgi:hypothetical protein
MNDLVEVILKYFHTMFLGTGLHTLAQCIY